MNRKFAVIALGVLVGVVAAAMATGAGAAPPPVCDPGDTECGGGGGGGGPVTRNAELTVVAPSPGTINSTPAGISCGTDCTQTWTYTLECSTETECTYDHFTQVTLSVSGGPAGYTANWTVCNANATGSDCSSIDPSPRDCDTESGSQCTMDMKGNYRVSLTWVDTSPPIKPTLSGPAEIGSGQAIFTASAADNSGSVARFNWFVDGVLQAASSSQLAVFGSSFPHGTNHQITARAFDAASNASIISEAKAFTVDRQTAVTIESPAEGAHFETAPQFAFTIDADATASCQTLAGASGDTVLHTAPACTGSYTPQVPGPGDYRIRVTATDDVGNVATVERSFAIDPAAGPGPGDPAPGPGPGDPADPADPAPTGRTISRRVTIAFRKGKIRGVVKPLGGCARREIVKLFKIRKGKDPVVGKDTTDRSGRYVIRKRGGAGRFYTRVMRSGDGFDTCAAARSKALIFANAA